MLLASTGMRAAEALALRHKDFDFDDENSNNNNNNNQSMNAIMKVYSTNGTLIKTTSFPTGFNYNGSESIKLATNIADKSIETVTAVIQLTNLEKTQPLSDPITIRLSLGQVIDK